MNGPYLLAPTATCITVAWETSTPSSAQIWYQTNGQPKIRRAVECERGTPWKTSPEGICLYQAVLTELTPDTLYHYRVELASGESEEGTFKTLKENPDRIHICTISDSHAFETNKELANRIKLSSPDFCIHSGDIPIGTGYQKEQFEAFWFQKGKDILKHVPFVYIDGNHDDGPYFADYFMRAPRKTYQTSPDGLHYSFDYGNTHFVMINSNPWGLWEMNAVNSNLPVDQKTKCTVKAGLDWLLYDLSTEAAQKAKWRVVVMHHPYTDHFTYKYVVNIVEERNVNLVIAGHLHFFQKNISINPKVGARTLYITQGSAQDPAGEIDYGRPDERILSEFPEVVALGKTIYSTVDITEDRLVFRAYGVRPGATEPSLLDETILVQEEPKVSFTDVRLMPDSNDAKTIAFSATAKNEGQGLAGVTLTVVDNGRKELINLFGSQGEERVIALNPGESKAIYGTLSFTETGVHRVEIENQACTIEIQEPSAAVEVCHFTVRSGQGAECDVILTAAEVYNPRSYKQQASLTLYVNGQPVVTQQTELHPYERGTVNFAYRVTRGGTYLVAVGDLPAKELQIEGTLKSILIAKDLSGKENHGLIRGNPIISSLESGAVALSLDHYGDYIEVPDSPRLLVKQGFTGMVWANMKRLPNADEKDHNPLMVKGPSVGWGVNYLLRMVVKKIGVAAWGTCHGSTEYAWDGGKVPIGQWAQYTSAFNTASGGCGYINAQKVAEISGVNGEVELRYWEGYPLFIGYSGIGHVIKELKRTKYFTHFPGQVSQVRFYSDKLSDEEIKYITEHPAEPGPKREKLLVWLNFKDIETEGSHITEWRQPAHFQPAYRADKQLWRFRTLTAETTIPGTAAITATVEVSDNQETVKGSKQIRLTGGIQTIDISELPAAQYIRIVSSFHAEIVPTGTFVPELHSYQIVAERENQYVQLLWGTRADWEKGSMTGAIGFEPLDRIKVIEEYTDVIH